MTRFAVAVLAMLLTPLGALAADAADSQPRFDDERLFTTAAQREYLDALRAGTPPPEHAPDDRRRTDVPPTAKKPPKKKPSVALQGFVRRSDGPEVVWANGQNTLRDNRLAEDIRIRSGHIEGSTVVVTLPNGREIRLEPGQVWNPDTGRVIDGYRR